MRNTNTTAPTPLPPPPARGRGTSRLLSPARSGRDGRDGPGVRLRCAPPIRAEGRARGGFPAADADGPQVRRAMASYSRRNTSGQAMASSTKVAHQEGKLTPDGLPLGSPPAGSSTSLVGTWSGKTPTGHGPIVRARHDPARIAISLRDHLSRSSRVTKAWYTGRQRPIGAACIGDWKGSPRSALARRSLRPWSHGLDGCPSLSREKAEGSQDGCLVDGIVTREGLARPGAPRWRAAQPVPRRARQGHPQVERVNSGSCGLASGTRTGQNVPSVDSRHQFRAAGSYKLLRNGSESQTPGFESSDFAQ